MDATGTRRHTSGVLGEPEHTSGRIGADPNTAMDWAATIVPVDSWVAFTDARTAFVDELHDLVRDIRERAAFAEDADMLTWASGRFGLDRQGWVTGHADASIYNIMRTSET